MVINFNQNSNWNLRPISNDEIRQEIFGFLVLGEEVVSAFQTIHDQLVFTTKRIIAMDESGVIGKKRSFSSLPYSRIQYFSVQTPSFLELVPDAVLTLVFNNGFSARFEFKGNVDIGEIGRMISAYVL